MDDEIALVWRTATLFEQNQPEQALSDLESYAGADLPLIDALVGIARGLCLERRGDRAGANVEFERVHQLEIPWPDVLRQCGRYFQRCGQHAKALQNYSALQTLQPDAIDEFVQRLPRNDWKWFQPRRLREMLYADRPRLYAMQPIKQQLAERLGIAAAGLIYGEAIQRQPRWAVATRPLAGLRDYARKVGLAYETLAEGRTLDLPAAPVFGRDDLVGLTATSREFFCCELADVVVTAKSNVLLCGGAAVLDFQDDELRRIPVNLDIDPLVVACTDDSLTMLVPDLSDQPPLARALTLNGIHSYAFGHWISEFLPKLFACLDRPEFAGATILIDAQMPPQHRESLDWFVGDAHPVRTLQAGESIRVERLWTCSMIVYMPPGPKPGIEFPPDATALDGRANAAVFARIRPRLDAFAGKSGANRLFLKRKDSQWRRMVNREEIEGWAESRGFTLVDFGELSFLQQLEMIRGAEIVLGPEGSSLAMGYFACPGTRIGNLNNEDLSGFEWDAQAYRDLGMRYAILCGSTVRERDDYSAFADFRLDIDRLDAFLAHLETMP